VKKDGRWTSASWAGEWGSAQLVTTHHQEGKDRGPGRKESTARKKTASPFPFPAENNFSIYRISRTLISRFRYNNLKKTEEFRKDTLYMQENVTRQHGCNKQVVYLCLYLLLIWKIKIFDSTKYDIFVLK
jgi:hypothetical protein